VALSLVELEIAESNVADRDAEFDVDEELELRLAVLLATTDDSEAKAAEVPTISLLVVTWEALERLLELSYCDIEALELPAADCELKLTIEEETAEEVLIKLTLLDCVLETTGPDEELTICAEAAYSLTSVVSRSLAGTEAARITRKKDPSKLTTAI
jgi:hypothetical protein